MENRFVINKSFDKAIMDYIDFIKNKNIQVNAPYDSVIEALVFIYGDLDLVNPYIIKDKKSLIQNLIKFGYHEEDLDCFFDYFEQNDLMNIVKSLIDMFSFKKKLLKLSLEVDNKFKSILNKIIIVNEKIELEEYFEKVVNCKKVEIDLNKINNLVETIDYLEVDPLTEKNENRKKMNFSFQLDAVNGFVSIMSILAFIAVICIGVIIINIIVG